MEARVSVAMCTYNGEAHLAEQLQSILQQSTAVQEVVICDDCSGDGTYALLQAYSRQYPGLIRLHRNPSRIGYARNFDQAISLCQGEVIFLSDQDDVWLPRKVEKTIEFLAANPQCGLVSVSALVTNEHLQPIGKRLTLPTSGALFAGEGAFVARLRRSLAYGCTLALRASLKPALLPIPACWTHDNWICFIAALFTEVRGIDEPLMLYRRHAGSAGQHELLDFGVLGQSVAFWKRAKHQDYEADFVKWDAARHYLEHLLETSGNGDLSPLARQRHSQILTAAGARAEFSAKRLQMASRARFARMSPALGILLSGQYGEFASGWRSFVRDLITA